jgi:uncharacterized membrane protein YqjE
MITPEPRGSGLPGSLRTLGATLLALVCARGEMVALELQEERTRTEQKFVLAVLATLFLAMGMLLAALLVVMLSWDTHPMLAGAGVTALYLGIGAWAFVRLRRMARDSPPPFSATLAEFANDLKLMRGSHE